MEYEDLVRNLNELDFLSLRGAGRISTSYYIRDTYYIVNVHKTSLGLGQVQFLCMDGIHHYVDFESVFNGLPEVIKMKIIFHLDLFGV